MLMRLPLYNILRRKKTSVFNYRWTKTAHENNRNCQMKYTTCLFLMKKSLSDTADLMTEMTDLVTIQKMRHAFVNNSMG
ncbi:hypothetical protein C482_05651 [Natrialba chahannaoensis JCM 10990]|uniref:Uncharacterized protein n=1 Tax=Natrialba chahannaoensis JCM 10990 TaxID=1227492 RepID=M0AVS9_9EURY|nr:hypothetical protein C482_05651 [Natrialba chahannaoensis JCM 10990]